VYVQYGKYQDEVPSLNGNQIKFKSQLNLKCKLIPCTIPVHVILSVN